MAKLYHWLGEWQVPGQQHKGASRVVVPSSPDALAAWLNERRVPICLPLHPAPEPLYHGSPAADVAPAAPMPGKPDAGASAAIQAGGEAIAEWLLDHATQSQVETVFTALGCRWGEARGKQ